MAPGLCIGDGNIAMAQATHGSAPDIAGKGIANPYAMIESSRMGLDLSSYEDVKAQAQGIFSRLEDGSMPCDEPWPEDQIAKFKSWIDEGMKP